MDNKHSTIMMLYTMTPTHAGSGTELSYVDLPIQREPHTGFPKIDASTLKGCIRCAVSEDVKRRKEETKEENPNIGDTSGVDNKEENLPVEDPAGTKDEHEIMTERIFGSFKNGDLASAVSFTDARLLFFPVKSAIGVFAWVTCPFVIQRFLDDYEAAMGKGLELETGGGQVKEGQMDYPELNGTNAIYAGKGLAISKEEVYDTGKSGGQRKGQGPQKIMLEDYVFSVKPSPWFDNFLTTVVEKLPGSNVLKNHFIAHTVMVSDDDFSHFVRHSTEVSTRIRINEDTGTVDGKGLFTEEFLPPESLLYSLLFFHSSYESQQKEKQGRRKEEETDTLLSAEAVEQKFKELFAMEVFQIGGDGTLGKGLVKRSFWEVR